MTINDLQLAPQAVAITPTQDRARSRFNAVLAESEVLLVELGLRQFSIPLLAERLGYTRGSIYAYFPSTDAILNELLKRYVAELESLLTKETAALTAVGWSDAVPLAIRIAAQYYNHRPAARLLLLGGSFSNDGYSVKEALMLRLGEFCRRIIGLNGVDLPAEPDIATLVADVGFACFRRSFYLHDQITPAYEENAMYAMRGFLQCYVEAEGITVGD